MRKIVLLLLAILFQTNHLLSSETRTPLPILDPFMTEDQINLAFSFRDDSELQKHFIAQTVLTNRFVNYPARTPKKAFIAISYDEDSKPDFYDNLHLAAIIREMYPAIQLKIFVDVDEDSQVPQFDSCEFGLSNEDIYLFHLKYIISSDSSADVLDFPLHHPEESDIPQVKEFLEFAQQCDFRVVTHPLVGLFESRSFGDGVTLTCRSRGLGPFYDGILLPEIMVPDQFNNRGLERIFSSGKEVYFSDLDRFGFDNPDTAEKTFENYLKLIAEITSEKEVYVISNQRERDVNDRFAKLYSYNGVTFHVFHHAPLDYKDYIRSLYLSQQIVAVDSELSFRNAMRMRKYPLYLSKRHFENYWKSVCDSIHQLDSFHQLHSIFSLYSHIESEDDIKVIANLYKSPKMHTEWQQLLEYIARSKNYKDRFPLILSREWAWKNDPQQGAMEQAWKKSYVKGKISLDEFLEAFKDEAPSN